MLDRKELERALAVTPGASQTRSKAPGQVGPAWPAPQSVDTAPNFPVFATSGAGPFLFVAGKGGQDGYGRLLDCFGANAAIPLGYNQQDVTSAVCAVIGNPLLSLPSRMEAQVSEDFLRVCAPWAQQVRWVKTGSEALSAAMRIARAATGRAKVVVFDNSYHGWHDWTSVRGQFSHDGSDTVTENGIPWTMRNLIEMRTYGLQPDDLSADTAAVVVEPHRWQVTDPKWLQSVVAAAHAVGALVVFDEMVYGLRWARGGAAEYYGVTPNLACFGKALGNGFPVACVCGTAPAMAHTLAAGISGTYGGELVGLAAAQAVLRLHDKGLDYIGDIIHKLWESGRQLRAAYDHFAPAGYALEGMVVHWRLPQRLTPAQLDAVLLACAEYGVLVHRSANNASAAFTPDLNWLAGKAIGESVAAIVGRDRE